VVGEGLHGSYNLPELSPISFLRIHGCGGCESDWAQWNSAHLLDGESLPFPLWLYSILKPERPRLVLSLSSRQSACSASKSLRVYCPGAVRSLSSHDEDERCVSDTITRRRLSRAPQFLRLSRVWLESPLTGKASKRPTAFSTPPRSFCPVLSIYLLSYFLAGKARGPHPHDHCSSVIIL